MNIIMGLFGVFLEGPDSYEDLLKKQYGYKKENIFKTKDYYELVRGIITFDEYASRIEEYGMTDMLKEEIKHNMLERFRETDHRLFDLVSKLKVNNKVILYPETPVEWIDQIETNTKILDCFDLVIPTYSFETPKAYHRAYDFVLDRLNVRPEECLVIDNKRVAISNSKKTGIHKAIEYSHYEDLLFKLDDYSEDLGVRIDNNSEEININLDEGKGLNV
ncbi:MAG: hypothetical protein N4A47_07690 [Clostridia bacterium]|jgi:FMN phosphatase YigB (HAD superfamily)|nr:hypothetical protein [Clostridia bacterium]